MAEVDVRLTGPVFDGRAAKIMERAGREAEEAVAKLAVDAVRTRLARRAKNPTGRFASRTVADRSRGSNIRVHTPGLRYATWLEGTARRNTRSSFKGYGLYREARQETAAQAPRVAGDVIGRHVREING